MKILSAHTKGFNEKRFYQWLFTSLLLLSIASYAFAEKRASDPVQLKKDISRLEADIYQKQKKLNQESNKIFEFDKRISDDLNELGELQAQQISLKRAIADSKNKHQKIQQDLKKAEKVNAELAKLYFMSVENNYFKILLNQGNPEKAARNPVYFSYLQKAYSDSYSDLKRQSAAQNENQKLLQAKLSDMENVLVEKQQKSEDLKLKREQRKLYLSKLSQEISGSKNKKKRLIKDQQRLQKLADEVAALARKARKSSPGMGFANTKDGLDWPVKGKIIGNFGKNRVAGGVKWRGLLIAAKQGTPVKAVADGTVVFADWLNSYGYVVIVEHGKSYMSLYGHNQQLFKAVGDTVSAKEVIAGVGNSGRSGEPALYFEVRHKGKPMNPSKWLLAKKRLN